MENSFKFHDSDYLPDEGEIYLEKKYQGKTENRNSAVLLFLSISVPLLLIWALFHVVASFF